MGVEQEIEAIRLGIRAGRFSNEASVSQGIVLRLLHALGWPAYNTDAVWPEYSLSGRRVDFALCSPPSKPIAFIEVKQIGQSDGAERQLFEYAYHDGVPMAILTDGREWNFFLPGEQGAYDERRVYKLDIVDRDVKECVERLERYLLHSAVASGAAIHAARDDYRNVSKDRQMLAALPTAWHQIIMDEDEMLLEIVADRVESLCGFKPGPDMVAAFLKESMAGRATPQPQARPSAQPMQRPQSTPPAASKAVVQPAYAPPPRAESQQRSTAPHGQIGFSFECQFHPARNAIDTLRQVFDLFIKRDPTFGERFAGLPKHGRTRRYLARDASELYRDRPDLGSVKLDSGWWMSTNHSRQTIGQIIAMACDVAHVAHGRDLIDNLGD
ncbi:MAG: hypothetical protein K2X51_15585 [Burkholderiales bacterium]|nr:hypothetical protein [Burkholderiales bacterium]